VLTKILSGLIGLILFFELNPPEAFCQQQTNRTMTSGDELQTSARRVYVRRNLKPNRISGLATVNYFGSGLGLGYDRLLNSDFHLGFSVIYTQARLQGDTAKKATEFLDGNMLRISATPRYFFWRNVFVGAGFHISSIQGQFGFFGQDITDFRSEIDFTASHLSADVILGNEWRFNNLFLAVDWFGFSFFQASSIKGDEDTDFNVLSRVITGLDSDRRIEQEIAAQVRLTYLTVRFGISF